MAGATSQLPYYGMKIIFQFAGIQFGILPEDHGQQVMAVTRHSGNYESVDAVELLNTKL
jgi:hypothetical protein